MNIFNLSPLLTQGTINTLKLWCLSSVISLFFGVIMGIMQSRQLRIAVLAQLIDLLVLILRGVPLYAQLIMTYFVLPEVVNINLSAFTTGFITLGICSSAYVSEIIRSGINALPESQWQAGFVLGLSKYQQVRFVILPQAFKNILPALASEYLSVLKSTSILASIGAVELTKAGLNMMARSLDPVNVFLNISLIYLSITFIFTCITKLLERCLNVNS